MGFSGVLDKLGLADIVGVCPDPVYLHHPADPAAGHREARYPVKGLGAGVGLLGVIHSALLVLSKSFNNSTLPLHRRDCKLKSVNVTRKPQENKGTVNFLDITMLCGTMFYGRGDMSEQELSRDIILYYGGISRYGYHLLSDELEKRPNKKNQVCFALVTYGGEPDAAYRIARALNNHYKRVEVLIADVCKSAGTLVCIGADAIVFGDRGELGPLDIQLAKPDELFESQSGLTITDALNTIREKLLDSFKRYLLEIRKGTRLSTKLAADISVQLAASIVNPIAAQIDPLTLGNHVRTMQIATAYGDRLNQTKKSLQDGALERLVGEYPCHSFVIDRKEAKTLFVNVDKPEGETLGIYLSIRDIIMRLKSGDTHVNYLEKRADNGNINDTTTNSNAPEGEAGADTTEHSQTSGAEFE